MSVKQKYLKDENGEIVSPITSANSVVFNDGTNVEDVVPRFKLLFEGEVTIPSDSSGNEATVTLNDNVQNYNILIVVRSGCAGLAYSNNGFATRAPVTVIDYSDYGSEKTNIFQMTLYRKSATTIGVKNNVYAMIDKSGASGNSQTYAGKPLTKIIGIKF